jgi:hypothetical protein
MGHDRLWWDQGGAARALPVLGDQPLHDFEAGPDQAADPGGHHNAGCREIGEAEQIGAAGRGDGVSGSGAVASASWLMAKTALPLIGPRLQVRAALCSRGGRRRL